MRLEFWFHGGSAASEITDDDSLFTKREIVELTISTVLNGPEKLEKSDKTLGTVRERLKALAILTGRQPETFESLLEEMWVRDTARYTTTESTI